MPEENTSTAIFNVSHVSTTVLFAQVKLTVLCVTMDISYKIKNVSPDVTLDTTFLESFVKNVKRDVLIVIELVLVLFVKLEDMLTTESAMLTAQQDQLLKSPT